METRYRTILVSPGGISSGGRSRFSRGSANFHKTPGLTKKLKDEGWSPLLDNSIMPRLGENKFKDGVGKKRKCFADSEELSSL